MGIGAVIGDEGADTLAGVGEVDCTPSVPTVLIVGVGVSECGVGTGVGEDVNEVGDAERPREAGDASTPVPVFAVTSASMRTVSGAGDARAGGGGGVRTGRFGGDAVPVPVPGLDDKGLGDDL